MMKVLRSEYKTLGSEPAVPFQQLREGNPVGGRTASV